MSRVVTCFLRRDGEVLLVRRSESVGSYSGLWGGISGFVESPTGGIDADADADVGTGALADARREIAEETGLLDVAFVRAGDPLAVRDGDRTWTVHPFLFDAPDGEPTPNAEIDATEWVQPPEMRDRETVPELWATYRRVAPTVETVRTDADHGSAYVSLRALEVLRDAAATADDWRAVADVARALRTARPGMAALAVRIDRVMATADRTPEAVCARASEAVARVVDADAAAAREAADALADADAVLTHSRSGTAVDALLRARPAVVIPEGRPGEEGTGVAARLAREGTAVTLTTDAAVPSALADLDPADADGEGKGEADADAPPDVDAVLVGADTVLADGDVVNKVGTRGLAVAAAREDVPVYVVAARDKIAPHADFHPERADDAALRDALDRVRADEEGADDADAADVALANPLFDRTPADVVTRVLTEAGALDDDDVRAVAADHREVAAWDDPDAGGGGDGDADESGADAGGGG